MISLQKYLNVLYSAQRALLGFVTPNLRAVCVNMPNSEGYDLIFYYNDPPTEDEEEFASLVDTEMLADFPDCDTNFSVQVWESPKAIPNTGICIYQRYEEVAPSVCDGNFVSNNANQKIDGIENFKKQIFVDLLCSSQQALIGNVTPNLRGVQVKIDRPQQVEVFFYYDFIPSAKEKELALNTKAKLLLDFPSQKVNLVIMEIGYPTKIPHTGDDIYRRYEKSPV